ncbi:MAG: NAD(P)/FAD-dependent oxidoreductase [Chloroflexi bacterium]|nr:NAD(P)/FAD-dependent oxidoreductase [Chloroflexota bacterium]
MAEKTIVVLGAGVGGLVAARELRKRLGMEHRVVLVDRRDIHVFSPSLLWLMLGWRRPEQLYRDLNALGRKGIDFKHTPVEGIDLAERRVDTGLGPLHYDYLVLSLGAELVPDAVPGLKDAGHTFYHLDGALRLREALEVFQGGSVAVVVASTPFQCPPAPYEASLLLDYYFRRRGLRDRVEMRLYTPEPRPIPIAAAEVGQAVAGMLEQRRIAYHPGHRITGVSPEDRALSFENGEEAGCDLLIAVPPHQPPPVAREAGLLDGQPWAPVDRLTMKTKFENVYAIGDMALVATAGPLPLPKAGVFAHAQAQVVAKNIAGEIRGRAVGNEFDGRGFCFLETGYGKAALASGDFFAEPAPALKLRRPARLWHGAKILFEQWWLRWWF